MNINVSNLIIRLLLTFGLLGIIFILI